MSKKYSIIYGGLFYLVLINAIWIYWHGLQGIFIFDDITNLQGLANIDEGFNGIVKFLFEGRASRIGRPISLFTFALQADSWPYYPWDFKYINLMIHLLNGCLIFWFILILTRIVALPEKRCLLLALLTSSIWLLHPLQVSTVLYVVQRMTQLSTLFTLIGLIVYLYGRQLLPTKLGLFWISLSVILCGILATLSKENGILLVLYIIVLEMTLLKNIPKPRWFSIWTGIFLYFPLVLLCLYFATNIGSLLQAYEIREFTIVERLLTQPIILIDYIAKILLFKTDNFGLFHDDFPIYHNLLEPITTLLAIIFLSITLVTAILLRYKWNILAFGILFFLAGHVLESSFIGLMLYFEHRNYLPMLGIIFSTVYIFIKLFDYLISSFLQKIAFSVGLLLLLLFPLLTWSQTDLWGKPLKQTVLWAQQHPNSPIAQSHAIVFFQNIKQYEIAAKYAKHMIKKFPQFNAPYLYLIELACSSKQINMPNITTVIQNAKTSKYDPATLNLLISIIEKRKKGYCSIDSMMMNKLFNALINNPNNILYQAHFYARYALFHLSEKNYKLAIKTGKQALLLENSIYLRLEIISWLIVDKQFNEAMIFLEQTKKQLDPIKFNLHHKQLDFFKTQIQKMQKLYKI
ncbi:MAG TPA: hypothetical protein ENK59_05640 [Thioploca sp.]|nr:hypothetical protein [Thioploca sp.]